MSRTPPGESGLLPIIAITSENYACTFSFWEASLDALRYPQELRHVVNLGRLEPPYGYRTASWIHAINAQLAEVVRWMQEHPGERFILTDTDIQFFPRFLSTQAEWLCWMREQRLDMLFMRERTNVVPELREGEVNGGFYLVHCNERTLEFWQRVLAEELAHPKMDGFPPYTDQYHINRLLQYRRGDFPQRGAFGVRWATIPDLHCVWSRPESEEELALAAFHHAVNTGDKPKLLQEVRALASRCQGAPAPGRSAASRLRALAAALAELRAAPRPEGGGAASSRLLGEARALGAALPPPGRPSRLARCVVCAASAASWRGLRWGSEDGRGYCASCWSRKHA